MADGRFAGLADAAHDTVLSMDDLHIRSATPADRADLRAAMIGLQEHERALHVSRPPGEQIVDAYLDRLEADAAAGGGAILIAERAGAFAGFIAGWVEQNDFIAETPESNRFLYVSDVYVTPGRRGAGLATRLLDALEARVAEPGLVWMRLGVLADNAPANRAYLRAGFRPYEVVYERRLRSSPAHPTQLNRPSGSNTSARP